MDDSDYHPSKHHPSQAQVQAQTRVEQEEGQLSRKKKKADIMANTNMLTEDDL